MKENKGSFITLVLFENWRSGAICLKNTEVSIAKKKWLDMCFIPTKLFQLKMRQWQFQWERKFCSVRVWWEWRTLLCKRLFMTMCWKGAGCNLDFFFFTESQRQSGILFIRCLTPETPKKEQNKLCYSFHPNELCKSMWQVNIGGLWRRYPQPPHSAEPRRPQPNEDWTSIIRRIRLPHERHTHTHSISNNRIPPAPVLRQANTHIPSPH